MSYRDGRPEHADAIVHAVNTYAAREARIAELEAAIALVADDQLILGRDEHGAIIAQIFCSDTFAYACADGEDIRFDELPELAAQTARHGWPAAVRWVAEKRKAEPLPEVRKMMREHDRMAARLAAIEAELANARAHPGRADTDCEIHGQYVATTCIGCRDLAEYSVRHLERINARLTAQLAQARAALGCLRDALDRMEEMAHALSKQVPVRDMAETYGEAAWARKEAARALEETNT